MNAYAYDSDVCVHACSLSPVGLFATPWTLAHQDLLFIGFPRQEYWSGLSFPPPEDPLDPGIKPSRLCLLHRQLDFFTTELPG